MCFVYLFIYFTFFLGLGLVSRLRQAFLSAPFIKPVRLPWVVFFFFISFFFGSHSSSLLVSLGAFHWAVLYLPLGLDNSFSLGLSSPDVALVTTCLDPEQTRPPISPKHKI